MTNSQKLALALQGKRALLISWEEKLEPTDPYLRDLKRKIRSLQVRLDNCSDWNEKHKHKHGDDTTNRS